MEAIELIALYKRTFPQLFHGLSRHGGDRFLEANVSAFGRTYCYCRLRLEGRRMNVPVSLSLFSDGVERGWVGGLPYLSGHPPSYPWLTHDVRLQPFGAHRFLFAISRRDGPLYSTVIFHHIHG